MTTFFTTTIKDAWVSNGIRHEDNRGWFQELFKFSTIKNSTGFEFHPTQINVSHSLQGVIRGIHYSIAPEGQAKYVSVLDGEIDDYIVDIRIGSPTFGQWEKVRLSATLGNSVLLGPNLGHAFQVTSHQATVCYAVTAEFNPDAEKVINPHCTEIAIQWDHRFSPLVSPKDSGAPTFKMQQAESLLPKYSDND